MLLRFYTLTSGTPRASFIEYFFYKFRIPWNSFESFRNHKTKTERFIDFFLLFSSARRYLHTYSILTLIILYIINPYFLWFSTLLLVWLDEDVISGICPYHANLNISITLTLIVIVQLKCTYDYRMANSENCLVFQYWK